MKLLVVVALFALAQAKHEEYIGWKSYYVNVTNDAQAEAFVSMIDQYELDILSHPIEDREGVLLVKPQFHDVFIQDLEAEGIGYKLHVDDLKSRLDYDDLLIEQQNQESMLRNGGRQLPYDNYHQIEVINNYLDDVARRYRNRATVVTAARSFEGRPIKYLRISTNNFQDSRKPIIFIDGGIHAREWISVPTVTWAIHKLLEDVTERDLVNNFDWILLPVVNPDGYKFTFTNSRFWRKTRSTDQHSQSRSCPGVDGNRNYNFFWNTVGSSNNPCTDTYAGSRAFSEVETRVVRDILRQNVNRMAMYISMHSFGSMILYPWGHDGTLSNNGLTLHSVGVAMATAIDRRSTSNFRRYVVGNSALVLRYRASGGSDDFAHSIGVPLSYTFELPGFGTGNQGFNLAPRFIRAVCLQTWAGIIVGARRAGDLFRNNRLNN